MVPSNGTPRTARTKETDQGESPICMQRLPSFVEVLRAHTESSCQSRPVLLHFTQVGPWFLEHFSDGKDSLNSPGSPSSSDTGAHPTPLPVLCQSQLFLQLCEEMYQGADPGWEKRNLKEISRLFFQPDHFCDQVHQEPA